MRGFRKLVVLGVLLVTLLLVIQTIDAGKKQGRKKELETEKSYEQENKKVVNKNKHTESIKQDKVRKAGSQRSGNFEEENQYVSRSSKFESKKTDVKKNIKFTPKDKKYTDENTKTSNHFPKSKKSKGSEEEFAEKFDSGKSKLKKTKPQYVRSENVDKFVKTVKKTTQKKLVEENENVEKILSEELNRLKNEEIISVEETIGGNPKKRKYKLVEVVLQEDGQEEGQEVSETSVEPGSEDQEIIDAQGEDITEKLRSSQHPKASKNKKSSKKSNIVEEDQNEESASEDIYLNNTEETAEAEFNDGTSSGVSSYTSRYQEPIMESCHRLPEDPNREGPKKLTLYVVEEEIDGQVRKRVVSEEDGVTMCEVADLLKETYNMYMPEE